MEGVRVNEIDFTTLTYADLSHALIKVIGNVLVFEVGDTVVTGPTPVHKLLINVEVFGKEDINSALFISTFEMISLPKLPILEYMTTPLVSLDADMMVAYVMMTLLQWRIHGAPVIENDQLLGIVIQTDIVLAIDRGVLMDDSGRRYHDSQRCHHLRRHAAVLSYPPVHGAGHRSGDHN